VNFPQAASETGGSKKHSSESFHLPVFALEEPLARRVIRD